MNNINKKIITNNIFTTSENNILNICILVNSLTPNDKDIFVGPFNFSINNGHIPYLILDFIKYNFVIPFDVNKMIMKNEINIMLLDTNNKDVITQRKIFIHEDMLKLLNKCIKTYIYLNYYDYSKSYNKLINNKSFKELLDNTQTQHFA